MSESLILISLEQSGIIACISDLPCGTIPHCVAVGYTS